MKWYTKQLKALEKKKPAPKKTTTQQKDTSGTAAILKGYRRPTTMVNPIDTRNRSRPKTDLY